MLNGLVAVIETNAVDGRTQRGTRNREAIIDALIGCYSDGLLAPSVQEVADRQWMRVAPLASYLDVEQPVETRIEELVAQRAAIFEEVAPVRRAALLQLPDSPAISARLARADRALRNQISAGFPDLPGEVLDAVDALASWDMWNRLRASQGLSVARAKRLLVRTIKRVIADEAQILRPGS